MNFRKAKPQGASFSRLLVSSHCERPEGVDPLHPQHTDKPGSSSSHPDPGSWMQAAPQAGRNGCCQPAPGLWGQPRGSCTQLQGLQSLTRITMEPVQGAGTSCPRPPQSFGCHQPEVNRFCSSNKLVTKATVLIPKCN